MSTLIKRGCFLFNPEIMAGFDRKPWVWPSNVAYAIREHPQQPLQLITWEQVMERRRQHQARRLRDKRSNWEGVWRPIILDVRYYDIIVYTGWQCYLYGIGGMAHWQKSEDSQLMALFPPRQPELFPELWYDWKKRFAQEHRIGTFDKHPHGRAIIWARVCGSEHWASFREYSLTNPNRRQST